MTHRYAIMIGLVLGGCVSVSKSVLMDRSAHPVPQEDVALLLATDSIPESCERVALLHGSGSDSLTDEGDMWNKLRDEAGKLGANAVQLQTMEDPGGAERFASALFGTQSDRDSEAIALWCPDGTDR